jgi:hypothetical protein
MPEVPLRLPFGAERVVRDREEFRLFEVFGDAVINVNSIVNFELAPDDFQDRNGATIQPAAVPANMTLREKLLYHHGHRAKLAVDAIAAVVAAMLLWQQHWIRAAAVGLVLPAIASACVLWFADLKTPKELRWGGDQARTVTWTTVAVRIAGVFVFWGGAWSRSVILCLAGLVAIALTWVRVNLSTELDRAHLS